MYSYQPLSDDNLLITDNIVNKISNLTDEFISGSIANLLDVTDNIFNFIKLSIVIYSKSIDLDECQLDNSIEIEKVYNTLRKINFTSEALFKREELISSSFISEGESYFHNTVLFTTKIFELKNELLSFKSVINEFYKKRHGFILLSDDFFNVPKLKYLH